MERQIRALAKEYYQLTGETALRDIERVGRGPARCVFADGTVVVGMRSGQEHLAALVKQAKAELDAKRYVGTIEPRVRDAFDMFCSAAEWVAFDTSGWRLERRGRGSPYRHTAYWPDERSKRRRENTGFDDYLGRNAAEATRTLDIRTDTLFAVMYLQEADKWENPPRRRRDPEPPTQPEPAEPSQPGKILPMRPRPH